MKPLQNIIMFRNVFDEYLTIRQQFCFVSKKKRIATKCGPLLLVPFIAVKQSDRVRVDKLKIRKQKAQEIIKSNV